MSQAAKILKYRATEKGKATQLRKNRAYRQRYPEKVKAQKKLSHALKRNEIAKPSDCSECGAQPGSRLIHGHHEDYSKPLEVIWLCQPCHKEIHA
jgi:hypothetical protein